MNPIQEINTNIPSEFNIRIIDRLFNVTGWGFATENATRKDLNNSDFGLSLLTYSDQFQANQDNILNNFGEVVFDIIRNHTTYGFKKIRRLYWNWYHPGSITNYHQDSNNQNDYSILYNLHTNDGGTEFNINNEKLFCTSNESNAFVFSSILNHRGIAPKNNLHRFSLNIITHI